MSKDLNDDIIARMNRTDITPIFQALLAAFLFGASAPISKLLLAEIEPISLAAFLYLGSGLGLLLFQIFRVNGSKATNAEAPIKKTDMGWLAGAIIAGGIAAPIILLFGLRDTPGATASLLLNFEGIATTLIAAMVFKEAVGRRAWWAIFAITIASILLSLNLNEEWGISWGAVAILAACVFWGIDNNFTRNISAKNPISIVMIKGLVAGSFSLILTMILGNWLPDLGTAIKAMLLGSLSYGLSITLFIRAMRGLGAARTSALFGTAPLAGVALSFWLLQESVTMMFLVALPLMIVGALLLVYEEHGHNHIHEAITHEHLHRHDDEHHNHTHDEAEFGLTHSHRHKHGGFEHAHHHMPDIHHRHTHASEV
ncbi:MAG: EamA family transporter [Chloroflexota bacterium]